MELAAMQAYEERLQKQEEEKRKKSAGASGATVCSFCYRNAHDFVVQPSPTSSWRRRSCSTACAAHRRSSGWPTGDLWF